MSAEEPPLPHSGPDLGSPYDGQFDASSRSPRREKSVPPWAVVALTVVVSGLSFFAGIAVTQIHTSPAPAPGSPPGASAEVIISGLVINYTYPRPVTIGSVGPVATLGWGYSGGAPANGTPHSSFVLEVGVADVSYSMNCTLESLTASRPFVLVSTLVEWRPGLGPTGNNSLPVALPLAVNTNDPYSTASLQVTVLLPSLPGTYELWMTGFAVCA
jgi:hypothetical protein